MAGSYEMPAAIPRPKRIGNYAPLLLQLAGLCGLALLPTASLQAQPAPWDYPYYDGYPPPLPPGRVAAREMRSRAYSDDDNARGYGYGNDDEGSGGSGPIPLAEIRRHVAVMGFHLIATPRHKDRIYLAETEDAHGLRHRIVFDAYDGRIIENTKLGPKTKRASAKPSAETASASGPVKKLGTSPKPHLNKPVPAPPPVADPPPDNDAATPNGDPD